MKKSFKTFIVAICYLMMLLCYLGLFFIGAIIEWSFIRESLIQFFNPFIWILVFFEMLKLPICYVLLLVGIIGGFVANKLSDESSNE